MPARIFVIIWLLIASGGAAASERVATGMASAHLVRADVKALRYVERVHEQLDTWADQLILRLDHGLPLRASDPFLDGRARFEVRKLRETYSRYPHSVALRAAIRTLADRHQQRVDALGAMLRHGVDQPRYRDLSAGVDAAAAALRTGRAAAATE